MHALPQPCDRYQVHAARMFQGVAQPLVCQCFGLAGLCQQLVKLLNRDLEDARQLGAQPRQGLSLAGLPAGHSGAVDAKPFSKPFLTEADSLAALREALPP